MFVDGHPIMLLNNPTLVCSGVNDQEDRRLTMAGQSTSDLHPDVFNSQFILALRETVCFQSLSLQLLFPFSLSAISRQKTRDRERERDREQVLLETEGWIIRDRSDRSRSSTSCQQLTAFSPLALFCLARWNTVAEKRGCVSMATAPSPARACMSSQRACFLCVTFEAHPICSLLSSLQIGRAHV